MRILFLGNHTVGVRALAALAETEEIVGVACHPSDPEDGVRYESVYEFATQNRWRAVRGRGSDPALEAFIRSANPDLIWISDYRYLLSQSLLELAPRGAVNLHPSLLPKYRGRAPINWAIINGETRLGLTAHFVDSGMDSGDIIEQISFDMSPDQDVGDALECLYPIYGDVSRRVARYFRNGQVPRTPQDHGRATVFPRRTPEDGLIGWDAPAHSIWNLVRAISHPYPGAFTTTDGRRILVWRASPSQCETTTSVTPGTIVAVDGDVIHVKCRDGVLSLLEIEFLLDVGIDDLNLRPGNVLGT